MAKKLNYSETARNAVSEDISAENDTDYVENSAEAVENTPENTAEISDNAISQSVAVDNDGIQTAVYIGPTIFRTDFVSGRVFRTHEKPLCEYYPNEFNKFPELHRLVVPLAELGRAKAKLLSGGNTISEAYKALLKKIGG